MVAGRSPPPPPPSATEHDEEEDGDEVLQVPPEVRLREEFGGERETGREMEREMETGRGEGKRETGNGVVASCCACEEGSR